MDIRARPTVKRKYKAESPIRFHFSDGLEFGAKPDVAQKAVLAGLVLVQIRFSGKLEHGNELLHAGQGQFAMRNRVRETEPILKRPQAAVLPAAQKRGTSPARIER